MWLILELFPCPWIKGTTFDYYHIIILIYVSKSKFKNSVCIFHEDFLWYIYHKCYTYYFMTKLSVSNFVESFLSEANVM